MVTETPFELPGDFGIGRQEMVLPHAPVRIFYVGSEE
jgi:hypothetical protein